MSSRQIKYNSTVLYGNKLAVVAAVPNKNHVTIRFLADTTQPQISVDRDKLKIFPYDKGDLIKYKNEYFIIECIVIEQTTPMYKLSYVNKNNTTDKKIGIIDASIESVDKSKHEKIISLLKFIDRYNSTVNFLNSKHTIKLELLDHCMVDYYIGVFFERCKFTMNILNKIAHMLKKTVCSTTQLHNVYVNPFDFITQEYQLITYDKAEKICIEFNLKIKFEIKLEKWSYDYFLRENNAFYVAKWKYEKDMKSFCEKRNTNPINLLPFINNIIIDKKIGNDVYKTTEYLMNLEKTTTDLTIDLFYDKTYDIPDDIINGYIEKYEKGDIEKYKNEVVSENLKDLKDNKVKRLEQTQQNALPINIKGITLEPEQKSSVLNSIKNKFSIITGPPGSGKTEILKCINYVFRQLHEDCPDSYGIVNPENISLLAPTGLAYINMQRAQQNSMYNQELSGTIHKFIYNTIPNKTKHNQIVIEHSEKDDRTGSVCECQYCVASRCECAGNCKKCKLYNYNPSVLEIDETSMIDIFMFRDMLEVCIKFNSRLILLGDVNQLPSIGPGRVLQQIIDSNMFTVTKLSKIKRQDVGSLVGIIKKMTIPDRIVRKCDFTDDSTLMIGIDDFVDTTTNRVKPDEIRKLVVEYGLTKDDTKFITSFNKDTYKFNTKRMNTILQEIFNPINLECGGGLYKEQNIPSNHKYDNGFMFRIGDKIIRTENDYSSEKMRANGEEATIKDFDGNIVTIQYSGPSDVPETIRSNELYENFLLNYCVTVHKSQGSQYRNVVYFIEPNQNIVDKKSIYTAMSRAQKRCFVISNEIDFVNLQQTKKRVNMKATLYMEESNTYDI